MQLLFHLWLETTYIPFSFYVHLKTFEEVQPFFLYKNKYNRSVPFIVKQIKANGSTAFISPHDSNLLFMCRLRICSTRRRSRRIAAWLAPRASVGAIFGIPRFWSQQSQAPALLGCNERTRSCKRPCGRLAKRRSRMFIVGWVYI